MLTPKSHDYAAVPPVFHHSAEYRVRLGGYVSKFGEISGLIRIVLNISKVFYMSYSCKAL